MNEHTKIDAKEPAPVKHFEKAHDVVDDDSLSKKQKVEELEILEQDARQLAEASTEGMAGGERNRLHDVLIAKDKLICPPVTDEGETAPKEP